MARYWAFYNISRRVVGLWFVSLGSIAVVVGAAWILWPQIDTAAPDTILVKLAVIVAFSLAIGWGVLLLRMPTYRPDLGDKWWIMSSAWAEQLPTRQDRNWWTGNPR